MAINEEQDAQIKDGFPVQRRLLPRAALMLCCLAPFCMQALSPTVHGIDVSAMDLQINPGDDFYRYANGAWIAPTEIPPNSSGLTPFGILYKLSAQRQAAVLQAANEHPDAQTNSGKISALYSAYMDLPTIEARGLQPLKSELDSIMAIDSRKSLAHALGASLRADAPLGQSFKQQ